MATVVLVVLGLGIGIGYYVIYVVPLQYTIIKVNYKEIKIDYFLRRLQGGTADDIFLMIEGITNEELIRQGAPRYGIEVTDEETSSATHKPFAALADMLKDKKKERGTGE